LLLLVPAGPAEGLKGMLFAGLVCTELQKHHFSQKAAGQYKIKNSLPVY